MAALINVVFSVIHRNVIHRFMVQALQDPPLCSSTIAVLLFKVSAWLSYHAVCKIGLTVQTDQDRYLMVQTDQNRNPT
jgi:hypothetical protein